AGAFGMYHYSAEASAYIPIVSEAFHNIEWGNQLDCSYRKCWFSYLNDSCSFKAISILIMLKN
ncbi:hypothetical protein KIV40_33950, partial [Vibrio sp. D173a]|uniref:hypothetical protein n=1 Tax=Vibrio sp. D173a TaxID=2836349 RepID=UPI0025557539